MPDFNPQRGGTQPMRRPVRVQDEAPHPAALSGTLEPAPKPWPGLPYLALLVCGGFIALQLWPSTHWRHESDPSKTWLPHPKEGETRAQVLEAFYGSLAETNGQKITDLNGLEGTERSGAEPSVVDGGQTKEEGGLSRSYGEHTTDFLKKASQRSVHIFVCTDESDFRPLAVLVNSTISNALHPQRIHFHLVLPPTKRTKAKHLMAFFPNANILIASEAIDMHELEQHISFRKSSKARKELASPYNFLPFYLPRIFPDIDRFIYLDSDIVVKGNIEELMKVDLDGRAVAAVEDCSQHLGNYFDFDQLKAIQAREEKPAWVPDFPINPEACVYNRGVLVIDTDRWIQENLTEAIEFWMDEFHSAEENLYKYGLSQPPFLLALYSKYKKLDSPWNVRGLGRNEFSEHERDYMAKVYGKRPLRKPFISPDADAANILHFNGKFKPWKRARNGGSSEDVVSLCGTQGQECSKLWWDYLDPLANDILKPDDQGVS